MKVTYNRICSPQNEKETFWAYTTLYEKDIKQKQNKPMETSVSYKKTVIVKPGESQSYFLIC